MQKSIVKNDSLDKNSIAIKKQIDFCLTCIESLSPFLCDSIKKSIEDYCNNLNSDNKKKSRYVENILNKMKKIYNIEKKKRIVISEEIKKNYLTLLSEISKKDLKKKITLLINEKEYLSDVILELLMIYFSLNGKCEVKQKNKALLKQKKVIVSNGKLDRFEYDKILVDYKDSSAGLYLHIIKNDSGCKFSEKSFEIEEILYEKSLLENREKIIFGLIEEQKKDLSAFEKKRQNYILYVYNLEKNMNNLKSKEIDLTYPVNKMIQISDDIIELVYNEMLNVDQYSGIENVVMYYTYKTYGKDYIFQKYDEMVESFNTKIDNSSLFIKDFIKKELSEISKINGILPTSKNLINSLNQRIIKEINVIIFRYYNDLEKILYKITNYMNIEEIVSLYKEICDNMSIINKHMNVDIVKMHSNVQKEFVLILSDRIYPLKEKCYDDLEMICKEYLNSEVYFKNSSFDNINVIRTEEQKIEKAYNNYVYSKYLKVFQEWNFDNIFYKE